METMASLPSNIIYTHVCYFFLRYLVHLSSMYSGRSCQVDVKTQTKQAEQPMRVNLGKPWPPNLISRHWFHQILRDFGNQICINMSYRMDQNLSKSIKIYYTILYQPLGQPLAGGDEHPDRPDPPCCTVPHLGTATSHLSRRWMRLCIDCIDPVNQLTRYCYYRYTYFRYSMVQLSQVQLHHG